LITISRRLIPSSNEVHNTNTNREQLISLNPKLKANPNKMVVGDVLIVPDARGHGRVRADAGSPLVSLITSERTDSGGNTSPSAREHLPAPYRVRQLVRLRA
jgi:hypothetical protein